MWAHTWILAGLLLIPSVILGLRVGEPRKAVALAITGIILGPMTESFCVAGGLWSYTETGVLPLVPVWIFPLWSSFPAVMWIIVRGTLGRTLRPGFDPVTLVVLLLGLGLEIALFVRFGHSTPMALTIVLPLAIGLLIAIRRLEMLVIGFAGGIVGPLCESLPIASGAWTYPLTEFLGMPIWLPVGYVIFAVLAALISEQVAAFAAGPATAPSVQDQAT
jgi:hypothetical protein